MNDLKFDLNDITIVPAIQSDINSRKDCNPYVNVFDDSDFRSLPLITAPMDTVVSLDNMDYFIKNRIIVCLPRGEHYKDFDNKHPFDDYIFHSFGLKEIEDQLKDYSNNTNIEYFFNYKNILIDIANGHMKKIVKVIKLIKVLFPDIKIMVGNIANPLTYKVLASAGADFIRLSVGSGSMCTTSANISIHYPIGSLITECVKIKKECNFEAKIVGDGGVKNYSDAIKMICLGVDLVMIGSLFNKSIESAGKNYFLGINIKTNMAKFLYNLGFVIKKNYRGMSTKDVQRKWGKTNLTTSEGISRFRKVEYTLEQWTKNFTDYLRSAMSYTNSRNLDEFTDSEFIFITKNAFERFIK